MLNTEYLAIKKRALANCYTISGWQGMYMAPLVVKTHYVSDLSYLILYIVLSFLCLFSLYIFKVSILREKNLKMMAYCTFIHDFKFCMVFASFYVLNRYWFLVSMIKIKLSLIFSSNWAHREGREFSPSSLKLSIKYTVFKSFLVILCGIINQLNVWK